MQASVVPPFNVGVNTVTGLTVTGPGGESFVQGVAYSSDDDTAEVYVELKQGRINVYLNRRNESDLPLYSSPRSDLYARDLRGKLFNPPYVTDARLRSTQPFFRYTAEMQTNDDITPGDTVTYRVYQVGTYGVRSLGYAEGSI